MLTASTNMISKHYCPQCESFDLIKLHRGFVEKRILGSENKLQCRACGEILKRKVFEENIPRAVPSFIESPGTIVDPTINATLGADVLDVDAITASTMTFEDITSVEVMQSTSEEDSELLEMSVGPGKAPPEPTGDAQLVDETIQVSEKKGVWPYVAASLIVFFGTAYAFIWMPMSLSAQETDMTTVDMTIGKPLQTVSSKPVDEPTLEAVEEVTLPVLAETVAAPINAKASLPTVEKFKPEADESVSAEFQLSSANTEKAVVEQISNPRLMPDLGTKADNTLGGLSKASSPINVDIESLVDVPQLRTSVRQYVEIKTDEESTKSVDLEDAKVAKVQSVSPPIAAAPKAVTNSPSIADVSNNNPVQKVSKKQVVTKKSTGGQDKKDSAIVENKKPTEAMALNKKAAALLGVSLADLNTLASTKSIISSNVVEKKSVVQKAAKKLTSNTTTVLLEKVTAKFMEQDLDKLLSN